MPQPSGPVTSPHCRWLVFPISVATSGVDIPPNAPSGYNVYWQAVEVFYGMIYRASNPLATQIQ
jgi:hypothetical protein